MKKFYETLSLPWKTCFFKKKKKTCIVYLGLAVYFAETIHISPYFLISGTIFVSFVDKKWFLITLFRKHTHFQKLVYRSFQQLQKCLCNCSKVPSYVNKFVRVRQIFDWLRALKIINDILAKLSILSRIL